MTPLSCCFALVALVAICPLSVSGSPLQQVLAGHQIHLDNVPKDVAKVRHELKEAEIIPTVVDDFIPSVFLDVRWSSGHASLGNTLKPDDLQDAPSISLSRHCGFSPSHRSSYVVVLTDPDAPSRDDPKWSEFCHWIATGHSSSHKDSDSVGEPVVQAHLHDVMPYKPPGPPKQTGKHRYVFLVLVAKNGTTEKLHPSKPSDRQHWGYDTDSGETRGVRDWAQENGLVPIGANFIYAEH